MNIFMILEYLTTFNRETTSPEAYELLTLKIPLNFFPYCFLYYKLNRLQRENLRTLEEVSVNLYNTQLFTTLDALSSLIWLDCLIYFGRFTVWFCICPSDHPENHEKGMCSECMYLIRVEKMVHQGHSVCLCAWFVSVWMHSWNLTHLPNQRKSPLTTGWAQDQQESSYVCSWWSAQIFCLKYA